MVRKWQKSNSGKRHLKPPAHVIESVILTFYIRAAISNSTILKAVTMPVIGVFFKNIIDRSDKFSANEDLDVCVDLHGDHGRRHGHQILRLCHGYQVHQNDIVKFQRGFNLVKMTIYVALFCISQRCYILSDHFF